MGCFVPEKYRQLRWHVILPMNGLTGQAHKHFEIAEWVNDEANGPIECGHWVRWGYCGDFPSLCQAEYVAPFADQDLLTRHLTEE
jgi:hypothetical protein